MDPKVLESVPEELPKPRKRRHLLLKVGVVVLVVAGAGFGATYFAVWRYAANKFAQSHNKTIVVDPLPKGHAYNILILGSDRRDVVESGLRNLRQYRGGGGQRADSIVLLHVRRDGKHAVLLHFPRDLRVQIPGHGFDKINAAYAYGGPRLMI